MKKIFILIFFITFSFGSTVSEALGYKKIQELKENGYNQKQIISFAKEELKEVEHENEYIDINSIVVNLLAREDLYLRASFSLAVKSKKDAKYLLHIEPVIKSVIIKRLSSYTFEETSTKIGKNEIRHDLENDINRELNNNIVLNVYLTEFFVSSIWIENIFDRLEILEKRFK